VGLQLSHARALRNPVLDDWLAEGGRAVGVCCVATPREVFDAAGVLPYRIRALDHPHRELANAYLSRFNCSYCRACLQLGLDGSFDFLEGLVETNGCDHLRGTFENWQRTHPSRFFHYLKVPHVVTEDSLDYFAGEVQLLREAVSRHFGVEIDDEALAEACRRTTRVRARIERLRSLREQQTVSGAEALAVWLLESAAPLDAFETLLDRLIAERSGGTVIGCRARLMLGGAATDEIALVELIEDLGGLVVADTLCYGSRAGWQLQLPEGDDPVRTLAGAYLRHQLCPRMFDDYSSRIAFARETAQRARIHGAVLVHNKFCDLHGVENVRLRDDLERDGVPVLVLEKEYGSPADAGRLRTRVQAFLERIGR